MGKRYYAVQVGDYYGSEEGSTVKREAMRMARKVAKENPGYEVRIALCTVDDDFVDDVIYVQRGWSGDRSLWSPEEKPANPCKF